MTTIPARTVRVTHLVFGLLFLGVALIWLLGSEGVLDLGDAGVAVPAVLIAAGVAGLFASIANGRRARAAQERELTEARAAYDAAYGSTDETTTIEETR